MPLINIEYDNTVLSEQEAIEISNAIQKIVSTVTSIDDVFVYTNSAHIKVKVAPVEIFVKISSSKVTDIESLTSQIKSQVSQWKQDSHFNHLINLTVIPMNWKVEIGI